MEQDKDWGSEMIDYKLRIELAHEIMVGIQLSMNCALDMFKRRLIPAHMFNDAADEANRRGNMLCARIAFYEMKLRGF